MTVPTESSTHIWLQVADGEQWSDADPLTASGTAPCEAVFTYDTLPPSLRHRVRISVVAEMQDASGLSEDVVLDHEVAVEELATSRIAFAFAEPNDMRPAQRSPAAAWDYTPMLRIDNHSIEGTAISLPPIQGTTGSLFEDAAGGLGGLGGGGSDGGGALSGLGGDGKASADDEAAVTAMWLEFELTPPSGEAVTVRSEIFDRIGPAARGGQVDIEPTPLEVVAREYVEMLPMWQIGLLVGPVANAAGAPTGEGILFQSFDGLSGQLDAMLRTFPGVRSRSGARDSGPSIVLAGLDMTPDDEGGVTTQLVLDAAYVPGYPPSDALDAARDARSVITAEAAMLSMLAESAASLADVGSVFEAARTSGIPMTRLEPGDPIDVGGLSEQAQARIEARLDGGYSLLTPSQAPSIGGLSQTAWFVIDPATGVVRDEHESGRHQMGEEAPQQGNALARTETTRKTTCAASKGWFLAIALFLSVLAGPDPVDAAVESVRRTEEVQRVIEVNRDAACSIAGTPG